MQARRADRLQSLIWIGLGLLLLWLLYRLSAILAPFVLGAILAYVCDPLVERLSRLGLPRILGTLLVLLALLATLVLLALTLLPLLRDEATQLMTRLPDGLAVWNNQVAPWVRQHLGVQLRLKLDPASVNRLIANNQDVFQAIAEKVLDSLKIGGLALFGLVTNVALTPVVTFYLLRDWRSILRRLGTAIPRPWYGAATRLAAEVDAVLAEFLRGQLLVMLLLGAYYSAGLALAGSSYALPIGVLTGLLVFVPYLGFASGLTLALLVAILQFNGITPVIGVLIVYGIGQLLEGFVLTPWLVGERIGLHPLAVIFALLAFAQLFGFVGVLLALPASAALLVALREVQRNYAASRFYLGPEPVAGPLLRADDEH